MVFNVSYEMKTSDNYPKFIHLRCNVRLMYYILASLNFIEILYLFLVYLNSLTTVFDIPIDNRFLFY